MPLVPKDVYYYEHQRLVHDCLAKETNLICCNEQHPELIYGCLIGEHTSKADIIHFLFVKPVFRKMGIAYELVKKFRQCPNLLFTHEFRYKEKEKPLYSSAKYNPYLFLNGVYHEN